MTHVPVQLRRRVTFRKGSGRVSDQRCRHVESGLFSGLFGGTDREAGDGITYWFMDEQEFARREAAGDFLETALVHGMSYYGTPLQPVLDHLAAGVPTILEIDLQGAHRVRQRAGELGLEVFYIFLAPPSFHDLVTRLNMRGTENEEQRARRLETAKVELASEGQFDQVIVNDSVDKAARTLWEAIAKEYGL